MPQKRRFLYLALPAAWAALSSCAAARPTRAQASTSCAAFSSDFRLPLDHALWETEPASAAEGLCGADPALLETTSAGLRLSLANRNWKRNGCAYGGLWSTRPLGYGTVSAVLKVPIHPGETTEFLLLGDALSRDGPQKAIEIRFLGKDLGGVQLRTVWDIRGDERGGGLSKWVTLGLDPGADFHAWEIRWEPGRVAWSVDGTSLCATTIAVPSAPLTLVIRHSVPALSDPNAYSDWNSSNADVLRYGTLDRSLWPSSTTVREISFVPLQQPRP